MSKKSKLVKYLKQVKNSKRATKIKKRCPICGRSRSYIRDFDMCRICFRNMAREGLIPGIKKSSW